MLQIMDDGRLTDGQGRTVNFKNTVIVMTSNVGSGIIHDTGPIGFSVNVKNGKHEDARKKLLEALKQTFRPEFLNRVDDIIVFNTLSHDHLSKIIDIQLQRVIAVLAQRGIRLEVTAAAKEVLMTDGYDPNYGARPMKRSIQRLIQDPLALQLLEGRYLAGDTVVVDADAEKHLTFVKSEVQQPELISV
jgi:ATP-dependent Clp protease ATP-binding subunit ClpA